MNPVDRFQALIRHPDYRRDATLYNPTLKIGLLNFVSEISVGQVSQERWREYVESYTFLRTWGLSRRVDPDNQEQVAAAQGVLQTGDVSIFWADPRFQDADRREDTIDPGRVCLISIYVDLERPMSELQTLFAAKVNEKRKEQGIKVKRTKPHGVDPWTVWDKMQPPGNTLLKITRTLCHVRGNPAYDPGTKRAYEQVTRAYQKAVAMIKEVGRSRNKALTEEAVEASLVKGIRMLFRTVNEMRKA